jgi:carbon starvation protein
MSASLLVIISICVFIIGYLFYGRYLVRKFDLNPQNSTPAHTKCDGVDYCAAKSPVLLGHHFASIAGAGPILGPIYAVVFGWVPVFLWILLGSLFVGGVHDFSSIVASIRHGGKSIGEVIEDHIGEAGKRLFLIFTWFMLILVVAVFVRAVASTFIKEPSAATSSFLFILLAVFFGLSLYRWNVPLVFMTIIGIVLLMGCILLGLRYPVHLSFHIWIILLFCYVFIAAVTPVWILLQPRDYLNSFLLYFVLIGGIIGIFVTNPKITFPEFTPFRTDLGHLFPILFVTVACGAISGFHSLVSSGTTSKQLNRETDARIVGYGGMLIEGVLAVVALITAAILLRGDYSRLVSSQGGGPIGIFSQGVGTFISTLGIPKKAAVTFAALAISAFALTSLDTATRLGRFIFQEFFESRWNAKKNILSQNRYIGTLSTVLFAGLLALSGSSTTLWPLFGSSNQLLAAIVLLAVTVWLAELGKNNTFVKIPMGFMFLVTLAALTSLIYKNFIAGNWTLFFISILLFGVAVVLVFQAVKSMKKKAEKLIVI